ncbi:MAG TPA: FAD-dependent oxidoreductase [Pseudolabrys sp.]|nr:FAD-dependent oxidoreductase [Pseudolabrys sp.]
MAEKVTPDICVIGGGAAGLSLAAGAAAFGASIVLVEKGTMGGECLNTGCVPSKALLAAARRARLVRESARFGVTASLAEIDFQKVHGHVHDIIAAIAPNDSAERFTALGVRVIKGAAQFVNRKTVAIGDDFEIRARRFVIATGSSPAIPAISGLESTRYFTNETIFDLTVLPEHLVVIGAGPVGLELAQAFRRLGSAVTVLEAGAPLAKDDPECADVVLSALRREGVVIRSGVTVVKASGNGDGITLTVSEKGTAETIKGTHLLVAAGRAPRVDGLGLDAARIKHGSAGIKVNKKLRTSNRRVYAIGDVIGPPQFTHAGNYHAGLVIRSALFRLKVRVDNDSIPWVTYTDPELAQTGLTEARARQRGINIRVLRWPYHESDRAQIERDTIGHIKVITDRKGGILGATIVGAHAGELITAWTLAISQQMNIRAFAGIVVPYPTLSEMGKRAAIDFFTPSLTSSWVRRIMTWLRLLG